MADENVALLQARQFFDRLHDPCDSFHHPRRGGKAAHLVGVRACTGREPIVEALARDSQSITMAGSSMTSGMGPSAGGVSCRAHSTIAALRSATIGGQ